MKQRNLMKKVSAMLLTTVMTVSTLPQFSVSVFAQDAANELPTVEQFATVDELKKFNTVSSDANPAAKVYFGMNPNESSMLAWWIAGSQNGNITLFASHPLKTGIGFATSDNDIDYQEDWGSEYLDGVTVDKVFANHYGASNARKELRNIEDTYFTESEIGLMNTTTVYTNDARLQYAVGDSNSNNIARASIYSTEEKLYLPFGHLSDNRFLTVGNNEPEDNIKTLSELNSGLRVDNAYWNNWNCWLRTPVYDDINKPNWSLVIPPKSKGNVVALPVKPVCALAPAFELNLSSVLFGSLAPAASDGQLQTKDAFTLRYHASDLGSAEVSLDKSKVKLTNIPTNKTVYLVAQNSAGAKAIEITNKTEVSADDMKLSSFENCKVWLETTDTTNRMTLATLATEEQPVYDLELPSEVTFANQHIGYEDVSTQMVEIVNTGNTEVSNINAVLIGENADKFTLDTTGMQTSLVPNGTTSFAVVPKADLDAGTYTAQVQITGETGVSKTFDISFTVEGHEYATEWSKDETNHWHECECGAIADKDSHTFKEVIDKPATHTEKGSKHEECSICGYKKESVEIPVLTPSKPDTDKPSKPTVPDTSVNDKTPETGDQTNLGLFASLLTVSGLSIAVLAILKKKKSLENR